MFTPDSSIEKLGADWKGRSRHFAGARLVSRTGKPLTPCTVENYWLRAHRKAAKQEATDCLGTSQAASIVMMALSCARLLLNDQLHFLQLQFHAWVQGWPVKRYAFSALPPRR